MKGEARKSLVTTSVTNPYRLISHSGRERIRFCLLVSVDTGRLQGITMWPGGRSSKLDQWKPFAPWMTPSWEFLLASYFLFSHLLQRYLFIFVGSLRPDAMPLLSYLLEAGQRWRWRRLRDNYTIDMLNICRLNHVNKRRYMVNWINHEITDNLGGCSRGSLFAHATDGVFGERSWHDEDISIVTISELIIITYNLFYIKILIGKISYIYIIKFIILYNYNYYNI